MQVEWAPRHAPSVHQESTTGILERMLVPIAPPVNSPVMRVQLVVPIVQLELRRSSPVRIHVQAVQLVDTRPVQEGQAVPHVQQTSTKDPLGKRNV